MIHISRIDGISYEIAKAICPKTGENYDITIIIKFPSDQENDESNVNIVGFYFGDYDFEITEDYIKQSL